MMDMLSVIGVLFSKAFLLVLRMDFDQEEFSVTITDGFLLTTWPSVISVKILQFSCSIYDSEFKLQNIYSNPFFKINKIKNIKTLNKYKES